MASPQPDDPQKRKRGRPFDTGFKPSDEQRRLVTVMASMGIQEEQMVLAIINPETKRPITDKTLRKVFREEIDTGWIQPNAAVAAGLYRNATTPTDTYPGGIPVAQIFWLKCRQRWQQNPERNPIPKPPAPDVDQHETATRIAFLLESKAHAAEKAAKPVMLPAKRKLKEPT